MGTIDQSCVQRMCRNANALQQTLSSITATREVALDNARNFYEMLYMDPEVCLFGARKIFDLFGQKTRLFDERNGVFGEEVEFRPK